MRGASSQEDWATAVRSAKKQVATRALLDSDYASYALTDCGNAERLIDQHGDSLRFCSEMRQWFAWDGTRWKADEGCAVQLAKKTIRTIQQERHLVLKQMDRYGLGQHVLEQRAAALSKWALRSEAATHISAMLRLAKSDPRVSIKPEEFDRNPWILNLPNGTLDLVSGSVREQRPDDFITKMASAKFDPNAACPRWERFLGEVFRPHREVIPFVQRAVGYTLTGDVREECIFALVGEGRNGKSTFLRLLHDLLGEYGGLAEIDAFMSSRRTCLREDIADMHGRRLVSAQEPAMNGVFAEATLKWVSGGDLLRARRLYEHAQEFPPTHKLWLGLNRLPKLRADDSAAWSRLRVIPFDVSFRDRPDRDLKYELRAELNGILTWAIQGCLLWRKNGLGSSPTVDEATETYRKRA